MASHDGSLLYMGGYQTVTTLNTGAAADRRKALSGSPKRLKLEAEGGKVFFKTGSSSVDVTATTNAQGYVSSATGAEIVDVKNTHTHISFFAANDSVVVHMIEVE